MASPLPSQRRHTGGSFQPSLDRGKRRRLAPEARLRARSGTGARSSGLSPVQAVNETELSRLYREAAAGLSERIVSIEMNVSLDALHARTRSTATIAFARQVAMYLTCVVFDVGHAEVGLLFGRDRTTVSHACAKVEDRRDDREFEARLLAMEALLGAARGGMQLFAVQKNPASDRVLADVGVLSREETAGR